MIYTARFSSASDERETPQFVFDELNAGFSRGQQLRDVTNFNI